MEWIKRLVSWFAHYLSRAFTSEAATQIARGRFPDRTEQQIRQGAIEGQRAVEAATRANELGANQPLIIALGGERPPEDFVSVYVTVKYTRADGSVVYRQQKLMLDWFTTRAEIEDIVGATANDFKSRYPGSTHEIESINPPLRYRMN